MPTQEWSDRIWLVQPGDEPELSEELTGARDKAGQAEPAPHIVVDCGGVRQMSSSNISQLLRLRKVTVDRGSRLIIANVRDSVWVLFLTTALDKVFDFTPDVPTALAALQLGE
jgi:anti-anti-sigma factor